MNRRWVRLTGAIFTQDMHIIDIDTDEELTDVRRADIQIVAGTLPTIHLERWEHDDEVAFIKEIALCWPLPGTKLPSTTSE